MNVYEAAKKRIDFMFDNFENIYVSISGGKDSGVCAHLVLEEAKKRNRKVGLLHIDIEASYQYTMDYLEKMYNEYREHIIPIWACLPMVTDNGLSYFEQLWSWWEESKKDIWVRSMPEYEYVINTSNCIYDFYNKDITFEKFVVEFAKNYTHYHGTPGKTACVVGIRTQESLNRWRALYVEKTMYKNKKYTTQVDADVFNFYPIYDWTVDDIWIYYGKFNKLYNKIYDLMYQAGLSIHKMRIDEPYGNEAKASLNLFRVLEPESWSKVVMRVSGANHINIYNKKNINKNKYSLPKGHTWESYTIFLLNTLPPEAKNHYEKKFDIFIKWWLEKGSGMSEENILLLQRKYGNYIINTNELSNRGNKDKKIIRFTQILDEIPELDTKMDVLSWKRLAMTILKNDYWCKSLSFGLTQNQIKKRKEIMDKYEKLL